MSTFLDGIFPEDLQGLYQQVENPLPAAPDLPPQVQIPGSGDNTQRYDNIDKLFDDFTNTPASQDASLQPYGFNYKEANADRYVQSDYFQERGFHPEKDNETIYGNRQTFGDTMEQAFAGAGSLAWNTFVDGWKGWGRLAESLFTRDIQKIMGSPEELEELHKEQTEIFNKYAIFRTPESENSIFNRQFLGDLIQQGGFALGTIGQFVSEELVTMGMGAALKPLTGARTLLNLGRAGHAIGEVTKDMKKSGDVWKYVSAMRRMYEGLRSGGATLRNAARLTPIGSDLIKAVREGATGWELAGAGFNAFRRTVAEANMAFTEARMEAAGTYGELSEQLRLETLKNKGTISPEDEQRISDLSAKAAWGNFKTNAVLIAGMNRLQLDNMFRTFGSDKRMFRQMVEEGSIVARTPKESLARKVTGVAARDVADEAGKIGIKKGEQLTRIYQKGTFGTFGNLGEIAMDFGGKRAAWEASKSVLRNTFKWEFSEGIQEMLQDVSGNAFKSYYSDIYNNKDANFWTSAGQAAKDEVSGMQGWKTFLMGAVTGRLMSPLNFGISKGTELLTTSAKDRKAAKENRQQSIKTLNGFFANPNQYAQEWVANTNVQNLTAKKMEWALANKDKYVYEHAKDSAFAKAVSAAKKLNMVESLTDTIREMGKHFNEQEFREAFMVDFTDENRQKVSDYMNRVANQVERFSKRYDKLFEEFGDLIRPERYNEADQTQLKLAKQAFHETIEWMATNEYRAGRAAQRGLDIMGEAAKIPGVGEQSHLAFRILGDDQAIVNEMELLSHEIERDRQSTTLTEEIKDRIQQKQKQLESLQTFGVNKDFFSENGAENQKAADAMMSALANYFISKNKEAGFTTTFTQKDIGDLFFKLNDFRKLKKDEKDFLDAYALIANPKKFLAIYTRIHGALNALRIEKMKAAAKAAQTTTNNNTGQNNNNPNNPPGTPPATPATPPNPAAPAAPAGSTHTTGAKVVPMSSPEQAQAAFASTGPVSVSPTNEEEEESEESESSGGKPGGGPKGPKGSPTAPSATATSYKTGDFLYHEGKKNYYYVNKTSADKIELVNLEDGRVFSISSDKLADRMSKGVVKKTNPHSFFGENKMSKEMKIMPQSRGGLFIVRLDPEEGTYIIVDKDFEAVEEDELNTQEPFHKLEDAIQYMQEILQRRARKEKEKTYEFDGVSLREGDILVDKIHNEYRVLSKKPVLVNGQPAVLLKRLDTEREFQVFSLQPYRQRGKSVVKKAADDKRFKMRDPREAVKVYAHVRNQKAGDHRSPGGKEQSVLRALKQKIKERLARVLRTVPQEKLPEGLSLRVTRNSNPSTRRAKEGYEDQNDNLLLHGEPISVELLYNGESIGFMPYYNRYQYYDTKAKKAVPTAQLTGEQFAGIFDTSIGHADQLLHEFKEAHRSGEVVYDLLDQELKRAGNSSITLSGNQVKELFDMVVSPGQYDWVEEPSIPLKDFTHNSIGGNKVVLVKNRKYNKDHYEEEVTPVLEQEVPEEDREKLIGKIDQSRFRNEGKEDLIQNMSSYVAVVELPNGQVRFLDLEVPQVSGKDLASMVEKLNKQMEKTREENQNEEDETGVDDVGFNDGFNNQVLGKIFIATRNKNKGTYLNLRLNAAGDLVLFFENRKKRTEGEILVKTNDESTEPFDGVSDFIEQVNAAIEYYDSEQSAGNKIGVALEPKNFRQHIDRNAGFDQLGNLLVKVSPDVVRNQSLSLNAKDYVARPFEVQPPVTGKKTKVTSEVSESLVQETAGDKNAAVASAESTFAVEEGTTNKEKAIEQQKADIEKRRQEELQQYEGRSASWMVKYNPNGNNLELTENETEEAEDIIQQAIAHNWSVDKTIKALTQSGYVYASRSTARALRGYIENRLSGKTHTPVNGKLIDATNSKYDAELAALEEKTNEAGTPPTVERRTEADELKQLVKERAGENTDEQQNAIKSETKAGIVSFVLGLSNKQGLANWTGSKNDIQKILGIDLDKSSLKEIKETAQKIYDQLVAQRNATSSTGIEAKKADIERRRQEVINSLKEEHKKDEDVFENSKVYTKRSVANTALSKKLDENPAIANNPNLVGHGISRLGTRSSVDALLNILGGQPIKGGVGYGFRTDGRNGGFRTTIDDRGDFIIISSPNRDTLKEFIDSKGKIKQPFSVILNGNTAYLYDVLSRNYPKVNFIKVSELNNNKLLDAKYYAELAALEKAKDANSGTTRVEKRRQEELAISYEKLNRKQVYFNLFEDQNRQEDVLNSLLYFKKLLGLKPTGNEVSNQRRSIQTPYARNDGKIAKDWDIILSTSIFSSEFSPINYALLLNELPVKTDRIQYLINIFLYGKELKSGYDKNADFKVMIEQMHNQITIGNFNDLIKPTNYSKEDFKKDVKREIDQVKKSARSEEQLNDLEKYTNLILDFSAQYDAEIAASEKPVTHQEAINRFVDRMVKGEPVNSVEDLQFYDNYKKEIEKELLLQLAKEQVAADTTSSHQEALKRFVDRMAKGEFLNSPEDLQFYDNHKKEIEQALKARQVQEKEKVTTPEIPGNDSGTITGNRTSVSGSDMDLKGGEKPVWMMDDNEVWRKSKEKGNELIINDKKGREKKVVVKEKSSANGPYLSYDGAAYKSVNDEWKNILVPRAIDQAKYQQAIAEGRMTAHDAKTIIESAGVAVPKDILQQVPTEPSNDTASRDEVSAERPAPLQKRPVPLQKFDGARNNSGSDTRTFLAQLNNRPEQLIGWEEIEDGKRIKGITNKGQASLEDSGPGAQFIFYNSDTKVQSKYFVRGDAGKMIAAVEKYLRSLPETTETEFSSPSSAVEEEIKKEEQQPPVSTPEREGDWKSIEAIPYDQRRDQQHADFIRGKFIQEFTDKGVSKEQAEAAVALMEARAQVANPDTPAAWYRKIQDIGEGEFQDQTVRQYQLPNGEKVIGIPTSPEVVNGFYSPIEKKLLESKANNLSATKWKELFGKGDETRFTGLLDFLNSKKPNEQVTKQEIQDFLANHRIEIVEVVKKENYNRIPITREEAKGAKYRSYDLYDSKGNQLTSNESIDAADQVFAQPTKASQPTKYSTYQLSGEKENYKEVLVTLPRRSRGGNTYRKIDTPVGERWAIYDANGEEISREYDESTAKDKTMEPVQFSSSHWQEPNIVVHLRMNTRKDAEGRKVLFIEELQSDWGQKGKKEGFESEQQKAHEKKVFELARKRHDIITRLNNSSITDDEARAELTEFNKEAEQKGFSHREIGEAASKYGDFSTSMLYANGHAEAPFVTDTNAWTKLGLKTALKYAVQEGAEKIAWTSGEQQNQRYDLSKQVDEISYQKNSDGTYYVSGRKDGKSVFHKDHLSEKALEDTVGKEVAERIIKGEGQKDEKKGGARKVLTGDQLKVGGKGMKGFYGEPTEGNEGILGRVGKAIVRELTGKEGHLLETDLSTGSTTNVEVIRNTEDIKRLSKTGNYSFLEKGKPVSKNRAYELIERGEQVEARFTGKSLQHSIEITPALKAAAERGQPLFQKKGGKAKGAVETLANGRKIIHALHAPDFSTAVHEVAHVFEGELSESEKNIIQQWAGTKAWTTQTSETFARGFERYLREGNAPTASLKSIFEKARKWLQAIYRRLVGSPIEKKITPEVKKVFDGLFLPKEVQAATQEAVAPSAVVQPKPDQAAESVVKPVPEKTPKRPQVSPKVVTHLINETRDLRTTLAALKATVFRELMKGKAKKNLLKILEAVEKDARVLAIKQRMAETDSTLSALKILTARDLRTADVVHIKRFKKWVQQNLPEGLIQLEVGKQQLSDLTDNMLEKGVKVGQFVADIRTVNGEDQLFGKIEVGAGMPFKYHEAFHAIFRLLLSEEQVQRYLSLAKKEMAEELARENKTLESRLTELYKANPAYYAQLSREQLEERLYEEYLADKFDEWKKDHTIRTSNIIKQFFRLLRQLADLITKKSSRSEIEALFYEINAGKYKNAAVADNRFTNKLRQTRERQEIHKDIRFTEGEWIQDEEGRALKIDVHLPPSKGAALIASLTATLLRRLDREEEQDVSTLLNDILDEYARLYDKRRDHYLQLLQEDEESIDQYFLMEQELDNLHDLFTKGRQQLINAVQERFDSIDLKYRRQQEQKAAIVHEKGSGALIDYRDKDASGGFDTMPKELLKYLSAVAVPVTDDFGNQYLEKGEPILEAVDVRMLYSGLQKAAADAKSVHELLLNLWHFSRYNEQCQMFLRQFYADTGLELTDDGYRLTRPGSEYLLRMVVTEFQRYSMDILSFEKDVSEGKMRSVDSLQWEAGPEEFNSWYNAYSASFETPLLAKAKEEKEAFIDQAVSGLRLFESYATDTELTDKELNAISQECSHQIRERIGISLHPQYIAYSLAAIRPAEKRTEFQQELVETNKRTKPFTADQAHTLSMDLFQQKKLFRVNEDATDVKEQLTDDAPQEDLDKVKSDRSILSQLSYANSFFDEVLLADTYENEIGEARVTRKHSDVTMTKVQDLINTLAESEVKKIPEIWKSDPFFENHYLLNRSEFRQMAPHLRLALISGMKIPEARWAWDRDPIDGRVYKRVEQGVIYNDYTDRDFVFNLIDPYFINKEYSKSGQGTAKEAAKKQAAARKKEEEKKKGRKKSVREAEQKEEEEKSDGQKEELNTYVTARHVLRVPGPSERLYSINLPVIKAVEIYRNEFVLTKEAEAAFIAEIQREYLRIQQVQREIKQKIEKKKKAAEAGKNFVGKTEQIYGYHTEGANGERPRGLTLFKTGPMLGVFAEHLEQAALRHEDFSKHKKEIGRYLKEFWFNSEKGVLSTVINTLLEMGAIEKGDNDNGWRYNNKMLPYYINQGFSGPKGTFNHRRDQLLNLEEGDIEFNVAQILVNDFLNTHAFNQLLYGDPAKSFGSFEEMATAAGDVAVSGSSAAFDQAAPALGVDHPGLKSHVVHWGSIVQEENKDQEQQVKTNESEEKSNGEQEQNQDQEKTWITVKALRYLLFGLGKLTPRLARQLDQLDAGETIPASELEKEGGIGQYLDGTRGVQFVYNDGKRHIGLSGQLLTKALTSQKDDEGKWHPLAGKEALHQLREQLEHYEERKESFAVVVPLSASKGEKANIATDVRTLSDWNFREIDNRFWRLVEKPVERVQQENDQQEDALTAEIIRSQYEKARNELFSIQGDANDIRKAIAEGRVRVNLGDFQKEAIRLLESEGIDSQILEFYSVDEKGEPRYNLNGPLTIEKFTELFFAYLSKQMPQYNLSGRGASPGKGQPSSSELESSGQQAVKKALDQLKQDFPLLKKRLERRQEDIDNPAGKLTAFRNHKEAEQMTNAAHDWLLPFTLLHSHGIQLREQNSKGKKIVALQINGIDFNSYEPAQLFNPDTGGFDGASREQVLSGLAAELTNREKGLAHKLGLHHESVDILGNMVAMGVPLYWGILFLQQPVIQEYYQKLKGGSSPIKTGNKAKEGLHTIGADLLEDKKKEAKIKKPKALTVGLLQSNLTMRGMDSSDQYSVLAAFLQLQEQTEYYTALQGLLKTMGQMNKESFDLVQKYMDKLQLEQDDAGFESGIVPMDLRQVLMGHDKSQPHDEVMTTRIAIYKELQSLLTTVFLSRTPFFYDARSAVLANLNIDSQELPGFIQQFDLDLAAALGILAYKKQLEDNDQKVRLASLTNGLLYDGIAEKKPQGFLNCIEILNAIKEKQPDNYFANSFLQAIGTRIVTDDAEIKQNPYNKDGINKVEINTWAKLHRFNVEKLQDGFLEIYQNEETNYLAWALFHYLLVKDGGQWASGSFIKFVANFMLRDVLDATGRVNQLLARKSDDAAFEQLFGMNRQQLMNHLVSQYLSHPLNIAHVPSRNLREASNLLRYSNMSPKPEIQHYNPDTHRVSEKGASHIDFDFWGGLNKKGGLGKNERKALEEGGFEFVNKNRNQLTIAQLKFLKNIQSFTMRNFKVKFGKELPGGGNQVQVEFPFLVKGKFENKENGTVFEALYRLETVDGKKIYDANGFHFVDETNQIAMGASATYVEEPITGSLAQWRGAKVLDEIPEDQGSVREPVPIRNHPGFSLEGYRAVAAGAGEKKQGPKPKSKDPGPLIKRFEKKYGVQIRLVEGEGVKFVRNGKPVQDQSGLHQLFSAFMAKNEVALSAVTPAAGKATGLNASLPPGAVNIHQGNIPFEEAKKRIDKAYEAAKGNPEHQKMIQIMREELEEMYCKKGGA